MKAWITNNLWWMLQVIGCTAILSNNILAKLYGLNLFTYGWCLGMAVVATGWMFTYSYQIAPTFLGPWFVAQGALALYGFMAALCFDLGILTLWKVVGAILTIVGGVLLIL